MKNLKSLLFFALFLGLTIGISFCVKQGNFDVPDLQQKEIHNLQMLKNVNLTIGKTNKGNIFVVFNGERKNYYILQTEEAPEAIFQKASNAYVKDGGNYLFIKFDKGENVLMTLDNADVPESLKKLNYKYVVKGYGLINLENSELHNKALMALNNQTLQTRDAFDWGSYVDFEDHVDLTCKCNNKYDSDKDCSSGGQGASSCSKSNSTGSCSVSCNARSYACCKN
jgi:hypothetical protein